MTSFRSTLFQFFVMFLSGAIIRWCSRFDFKPTGPTSTRPALSITPTFSDSLSMREFYRERESPITLVPVQLNDLVHQVVDLTRARWSDMVTGSENS